MQNCNNMFSTFKNGLSTEFQPNIYKPNFPPNCPNKQIECPQPNKPYEMLNQLGELIGYFWYYGDSITLEFDIDGTITLENNDLYMSDVLKSLTFVATFYNFRKEPIITFSTYPLCEHTINADFNTSNENGLTNGKIIINIDKELSNELFIRGIYYLSLDITYPNGMQETLFSQDTCKFEVR